MNKIHPLSLICLWEHEGPFFLLLLFFNLFAAHAQDSISVCLCVYEVDLMCVCTVNFSTLSVHFKCLPISASECKPVIPVHCYFLNLIQK